MSYRTPDDGQSGAVDAVHVPDGNSPPDGRQHLQPVTAVLRSPPIVEELRCAANVEHRSPRTDVRRSLPSVSTSFDGNGVETPAFDLSTLPAKVMSHADDVPIVRRELEDRRLVDQPSPCPYFGDEQPTLPPGSSHFVVGPLKAPYFPASMHPSAYYSQSSSGRHPRTAPLPLRRVPPLPCIAPPIPGYLSSPKYPGMPELSGRQQQQQPRLWRQQQQQQSTVVVTAGIGTGNPSHERYVSVYVQSFAGHITLACFVLWFCGIVFGLAAFILAGKWYPLPVVRLRGRQSSDILRILQQRSSHTVRHKPSSKPIAVQSEKGI